MAQRGICSRREADHFIASGFVYVDNKPVTILGTKIRPDQRIDLHADAQRAQKSLITVLLNKPLGYVSGQAEKGYLSAARLLIRKNYRGNVDCFPDLSSKLSKNFAPAGRLDINSSGLLVLTQDGRIAKHLIDRHSQIEKEYLVKVNGALSRETINILSKGLVLDGKPLKSAKVIQQKANLLNITLVEGRKRQIRRMCQLVGLEVIGLTRVRIGNIRLGGLAIGCWRTVKENEIF